MARVTSTRKSWSEIKKEKERLAKAAARKSTGGRNKTLSPNQDDPNNWLSDDAAAYIQRAEDIEPVMRYLERISKTVMYRPVLLYLCSQRNLEFSFDRAGLKIYPREPVSTTASKKNFDFFVKRNRGTARATKREWQRANPEEAYSETYVGSMTACVDQSQSVALKKKPKKKRSATHGASLTGTPALVASTKKLREQDKARQREATRARLDDRKKGLKEPSTSGLPTPKEPKKRQAMFDVSTKSKTMRATKYSK